MDSKLKLLTQEIHPFERWFPLMHHYSSDKFSSKPSSLSDFINYGKTVSCFRNGENKRTVERAFVAIHLAKHGATIEEAIKEAWKKYPLATK